MAQGAYRARVNGDGAEQSHRARGWTRRNGAEPRCAGITRPDDAPEPAAGADGQGHPSAGRNRAMGRRELEPWARVRRRAGRTGKVLWPHMQAATGVAE